MGRPFSSCGRQAGDWGMAARKKRGEMVPQRQAMAGGTQAQMRKVRGDGWSEADERLFLETLAETCNASEAARVIGKSRTGAYRRKKADPVFAQAWAEALVMGYEEIELLLMREILFGSEVEDITLDAEGAVKTRKVKRSRNMAVALRLLAYHRDTMLAMRQAAAGATVERPDSPDAIARVDAIIEGVRVERGRAEGVG